jgi:hypothetical protein
MEQLKMKKKVEEEKKLSKEDGKDYFLFCYYFKMIRKI